MAYRPVSIWVVAGPPQRNRTDLTIYEEAIVRQLRFEFQQHGRGRFQMYLAPPAPRLWATAKILRARGTRVIERPECGRDHYELDDRQIIAVQARIKDDLDKAVHQITVNDLVGRYPLAGQLRAGGRLMLAEIARQLWKEPPGTICPMAMIVADPYVLEFVIPYNEYQYIRPLRPYLALALGLEVLNDDSVRFNVGTHRRDLLTDARKGHNCRDWCCTRRRKTS